MRFIIDAGVVQDDDGVDMRLANGTTQRARYLVGCDGGRSIVRKSAGIAFPGWEATTSSMIAQVEMTQEPELGIRHDAIGRHALGKVEYDIVDGFWGDAGESIDVYYAVNDFVRANGANKK